MSSPLFLSFQKFSVGGNLNVKGQFDIHQVLIFSDLACHVLLGSLQCLLQVLDASLGIPHGQLTTLLSLSYLILQVSPL